jgi:hypothetical protein
VVRDRGELKRWIAGELSLTPTPAEPRSHLKADPDSIDGDDATPEAGTEAVKAADAGGVIAAALAVTQLSLRRRYAGTETH